MKARKDLAHADVLTLSRDELATIFRTSGQEWASEHVSLETRRSLVCWGKGKMGGPPGCAAGISEE
jgi:hypothetical protein